MADDGPLAGAFGVRDGDFAMVLSEFLSGVSLCCAEQRASGGTDTAVCPLQASVLVYSPAEDHSHLHTYLACDPHSDAMIDAVEATERPHTILWRTCSEDDPALTGIVAVDDGDDAED